MTKPEQDWFAEACGALTAIEEEDNEAAAPEFEKSKQLLATRFAAAEAHDAGGKVKAQLEKAEVLAAEEKFAEALEAVNAAGVLATEVISAAPGKMPVTAGEPGDLKVLKGKEKGTLYIDEQYQEDEQGNVKRGGKFRGNSANRTRYYDDELKDKSAIRTDEEGRMVDRDGQLLSGKQGYAVSAEKGTAHTFDPELVPREERKGKKLLDHHTSPLEGMPAAAAGIQETKDGVVRKINSESGHYKPQPEHTHQYVEGLKEQGVQMEDKTLKMIDADGDAVNVSRKVRDQWNKLQEYERKRAESGETGEYDPEYKALKKTLQARGVGPANTDATVEVFDKRSVISDAEWDKSKGNKDAVEKMLKEKLGIDDATDLTFRISKPDDREHCNDVLGRCLRFGAGGENAGRVTMKSEQFVQTGGNMDQVHAKKKVGDDILNKQIAKLGGVKRLAELGVADADKLPLQRQLEVLEAQAAPPSAPPRPAQGAQPEAQPESKGAAGNYAEFKPSNAEASNGPYESEPEEASAPYAEFKPAESQPAKGPYTSVPETPPQSQGERAEPKTTGGKLPVVEEPQQPGTAPYAEFRPSEAQSAKDPYTPVPEAAPQPQGGRSKSTTPGPKLPVVEVPPQPGTAPYAEFTPSEAQSAKDPYTPVPEAAPQPQGGQAKTKTTGPKLPVVEVPPEPGTAPYAEFKPSEAQSAKGPYAPVEEKDSGKEAAPSEVLETEPIERKPPVSQRPEARPPKAPPAKPNGPEAIDIRKVQKPTKPDPLLGEYEKLGGDEALLNQQVEGWKKRNAAALTTYRDLEKRRKAAVAAVEKSKENPEQGALDQAALEAITKEHKKFKDDLDARDPMPTRARLAKLPVAERIKMLGS